MTRQEAPLRVGDSLSFTLDQRTTATVRLHGLYREGAHLEVLLAGEGQTVRNGVLPPGSHWAFARPLNRRPWLHVHHLKGTQCLMLCVFTPRGKLLTFLAPLAPAPRVQRFLGWSWAPRHTQVIL